MATETSARQPLRVLVIGAGPAPDAIHLPFLAGLRDRGEIVLALVCDIQRERAAVARQKFGFLQDTGDAVAALGRTDIDAVYIFGSAQLHYECGMLTLRSGKHLFVEKPVAPTYAQARELAEVARAQGLIAVGGLNRRFSKSLGAVRARAGGAGVLGAACDAALATVVGIFLGVDALAVGCAERGRVRRANARAAELDLVADASVGVTAVAGAAAHRGASVPTSARRAAHRSASVPADAARPTRRFAAVSARAGATGRPANRTAAHHTRRLAGFARLRSGSTGASCCGDR